MELKVIDPAKVFPEYYVIRVNEFDKLATDPLEEWIRYLKDEYISPDTKAPGLKEARERLEYLRMTPEQQRAYDHYVDTQVRDADVYRVQMLELKLAREKLLKAQLDHDKLLAEGRAEERIIVAKNLKQMGLSVPDISKATNLSAEEIVSILRNTRCSSCVFVVPLSPQ